MAAPGGHAGPIVLEIDAHNGEAIETPIIRQLVDEELKKHGRYSVGTTSFLIFPWKLWHMLGEPDLTRFTNIYLKRIYPVLSVAGRSTIVMAPIFSA